MPLTFAFDSKTFSNNILFISFLFLIFLLVWFSRKSKNTKRFLSLFFVLCSLKPHKTLKNSKRFLFCLSFCLNPLKKLEKPKILCLSLFLEIWVLKFVLGDLSIEVCFWRFEYRSYYLYFNISLFKLWFLHWRSKLLFKLRCFDHHRLPWRF